MPATAPPIAFAITDIANLHQSSLAQLRLNPFQIDTIGRRNRCQLFWIGISAPSVMGGRIPMARMIAKRVSPSDCIVAKTSESGDPALKESIGNLTRSQYFGGCDTAPAG